MKLSTKYNNDIQERKELVNAIVFSIKKHYTVQKVAEDLKLPRTLIINVLFSEFDCNDIVTLRKKINLNKTLSNKRIEYLNNVKKLYDEHKTLDSVGSLLGISREMVRQLLVKGQVKGLFEYEPTRDYEFNLLLGVVAKDALLNQIKSKITPKKVCSFFNITEPQYKRLIKHYDINLPEHRFSGKKTICIKEYHEIVASLGHHPTTTEMNTRSSWRALWARISRFWGSFDDFRYDQEIIKPEHRMHQNTLDAFKKNKENKIENKNRRINQVYEFISINHPTSSTVISQELGIKPGMLNIYLNMLLNQSKIQRIGSGYQSKYLLIS